MRKELTIKSKSLGGTTDLTFLAPLKKGFVPSLDSVTYKTRLRQLLKTLNAGRSSSHEYLLLRPLSDAVERTAKIHAVRVLILEPEDKVLLAVTFDSGWESYIRVLWQKVGRLLDSIFCNTEPYVSALDHSFEEWAAWVDSIQQETSFFYGMPQLSVEDVQYLRKQEKLWRENLPTLETDLKSSRLRILAAEDEALEIAAYPPDNAKLYRYSEPGRIATQSMVGLYALSSLYPPGTDDGRYLHSAAQVLLLEFAHILLNIENFSGFYAVKQQIEARFKDELEWLLQPTPKPYGFTRTRVPPPPLPKLLEEVPSHDTSDIQGGVIRPYQDVQHGCLVMIGFSTSKAAAATLNKLHPLITKDSSKLGKESIAYNLALTNEGLRAAGLSEEQLDFFPLDFRQGMDARSSILGDYHTNHPRRWDLPKRNWTTNELGESSPSKEMTPVEISSVHLMVQLRSNTLKRQPLDISEPSHVLFKPLKSLLLGIEGARILSVQPMLRHHNDQGAVIEHFGYVDGESTDPVISPERKGRVFRNQAHLGDVLLGYPNAADAAPKYKKAKRDLLLNGTFLVIRKLKQDVKTLHDAVSKGVSSLGHKEITEELVYAKMMGRYRDGRQLVSDRTDNDFDYSQDSEGSKCPFHSHLRRSNPRVSLSTDHIPEPGSEETVIDLDGKIVPNNPNSILTMGVPSLEGARIPRLFRRGMSYGPRYDTSNPDSPSNQEDRGLVFMAYNASISEQFEVVQRWVSGGNSTAGFSGEKDPLLGVPANGEKRRFRFEHKTGDTDQVFRMDLDGADPLPDDEGPAPNYLGDVKPFVRLEWGAYLFTPSLTAIKKIAKIAKSAVKPTAVWSDELGLKEIARLEAYGASHGKDEAVKEWKRVLEDPKSQDDWVNASLLSAVRKHHRGMYRAPGGVIVASSILVKQVLLDSAGHYSVSGYHARMKDSIGEIYLGLDKGPKYDKLSTAVNAALMSISTEDAFTLARKSARNKLEALIANEKNSAVDSQMDHWDLTFSAREIIDYVLQEVCIDWFGLPDASDNNAQNKNVTPGGPRWEVPPRGPSRFPGDFTAPSRFIFQPWPGDEASRYGEVYGKALNASFRKFVASFGAGEFPLKPDLEPAPVSEVIFKTFKDKPELITATLVGTLMGLLPTLDGNLKLVLNEWLKESTFWSLRLRLIELSQGGTSTLDFEQVRSLIQEPMHRAMQIRATPEYIWRIAKEDHSLGGLKIFKGEKILVSLISANQEAIEQGEPLDHFVTFGGNRREATHPTHACPGYSAAQGVLMGVFCALLEMKDNPRPTPAPLSFKLEGPLEGFGNKSERLEPGLASTFSAQQISAAQSVKKSAAKTATKSLGELLAYGDSWLRGYSDLTDISEVLALNHGYVVTRRATFCFPGYKLSTLASNLFLNGFTRYLRDLPLNPAQRPKAILISAGGNDVKDDTLQGFMFDYDPAKPESQVRLNDSFLKIKIPEMRDQYRKIFQGVVAASRLNGTGASIPILVHGYANPIVDGRYLTGEPRFKSWLWSPFAQRKYFGKLSLNSNPPQPDPVATAKSAAWIKMRENARITMRQVIGAFNTMLEELIKKEFSDTVSYIDLRKLFNEDPAFDYKKLWVNELHPNAEGYKLIGQQYAKVLSGLKTKVIK